MVSYEEHRSLLRCFGEEDSATQSRRRPDLARAVKARSDVVVDLTDLSFADPSLIFDLAILAQRLRASGRQLLLTGAQPHIARLIEMVGLSHQPGVRVAG